jgi:hypothetical protein
LQQRFDELIKIPPTGSAVLVFLTHIMALERYNNFAKKFTDQIERRLLQGETIAASQYSMR